MAEWLKELCVFNKDCVSSRQGRTLSDFLDARVSSTRRKTKHLRDEYRVHKLIYATQMSLRAQGKLKEAEIVKHALSASFENRRGQTFPFVKPQMSNTDAVQMLVEAKLTKSQYNVGKYVCEISPPYKEIQKEKSKLP